VLPHGLLMTALAHWCILRGVSYSTIVIAHGHISRPRPLVAAHVCITCVADFEFVRRAEMQAKGKKGAAKDGRLNLRASKPTIEKGTPCAGRRASRQAKQK
jgi:hypothetical protein